jgi:hypothetical protein
MQVKWEAGKYGFWYLRFSYGFMVTVGWDSMRSREDPNPGGYQVTFQDTTLRARFTELSEAKKAGEDLIRRQLRKVLQELEEN